jgi:hypothetical protein
MKPETPATGILKTNDFGNSKWYQIVCGCGQPDHTLTVEVEADELGVNVNTYATVKTNYWTETVEKRYDSGNPWMQEFDWFWKDLVNGLVTRLKLTWDVWFNGYVKCETTTLMSKQQTLNYAEILKSAIKDVEYFNNTSDAERQERRRMRNIAMEGDCV